MKLWKENGKCVDFSKSIKEVQVLQIVVFTYCKFYSLRISIQKSFEFKWFIRFLGFGYLLLSNVNIFCVNLAKKQSHVSKPKMQIILDGEIAFLFLKYLANAYFGFSFRFVTRTEWEANVQFLLEVINSLSLHLNKKCQFEKCVAKMCSSDSISFPVIGGFFWSWFFES